MKLIAHRGNIDGPNKLENHPSYIDSALQLGFDCEVDVWYIDGNYMLGHDSPDYIVKKLFLQNKKLWCHSKNLQALEHMVEDKIHCFWHQTDDFTLTSNGYIWTYPQKNLCKKSIIVQLDSVNNVPLGCYGICSDYVSKKK